MGDKLTDFAIMWIMGWPLSATVDSTAKWVRVVGVVCQFVWVIPGVILGVVPLIVGMIIYVFEDL